MNPPLCMLRGGKAAVHLAKHAHADCKRTKGKIVKQLAVAPQGPTAYDRPSPYRNPIDSQSPLKESYNSQSQHLGYQGCYA